LDDRHAAINNSLDQRCQTRPDWRGDISTRNTKAAEQWLQHLAIKADESSLRNRGTKWRHNKSGCSRTKRFPRHRGPSNKWFDPPFQDRSLLHPD
jgi:hypothetical protein